MFDYILKVLRLNYKEIRGENRNYFINDRNEIVATTSKNIITMYYKVDKEIIWNHNDLAAVTIAKDFCIDNRETNVAFASDVMFVEGLCGACNDVELIGNYFLKTYSNHDYYIDDLYPNKFGSCGILKQIGDKYSIDICGQLLISNINANLTRDSDEEFNLFLLGAKKDISHYVDYNEIYTYFRKLHNWYYTNGRRNVSSPIIQAFDKRRKYSTIDKYETVTISKPIQLEFIIGNIFKKLDEIYFDNSNKSLHSKKLQMYYILITCGFNKNDALQFLNNYDFSIRKTTLKKLTKQRNQ